ncbi:MAG TPA: hypothetical protein VK387_00885 [Thermoleophilaceae bacterium]|nr:hypothetical protein [Thermoleophilaceae bacterium]
MAAPSSARGDEGLSLQTLIVASAASAGAAILVSLFWQQGTIVAAAITPVLVALLREAFHRPAQKLSTVRPTRPLTAARTGARTARATAARRAGGGGGALAGGAASAGALHERETEPFAPEPAPGEEETQRRDEADPTRALADGAEPRTAQMDAETEQLAGASGGDAESRALRDAEGERPTEPLTDFTRPLEGHLGAGAGAPPSSGAPDPPLNGDPSRFGRTGGAGEAARGRVHTRRGSLRRLHRPRVKLAIVTGLLAFLIAAAVLTVPELITGESLAPGSGRTTLFPGTEAGSSGDAGIEDSPIDAGQDGSSGGSDSGTSPDTEAGSGGGTTSPDSPSGDSGSGGDSPSSSPPSEPSQPQGADGSSGGSSPPRSEPSGGTGGGK